MADKVFNIKFNVDGNVGPLKSALDGIRGSFEKLKLPDNLGKNFISTFDKLENEVKNFEAITSKGFQNMGDIGKAEKSYEKITTLFSRLQQEVAHIKGVDPNKLLPPEALERTKQLKTAWEGLLKAQQQDINIKAKLSEQNSELEKQRQLLKEIESLSQRENKLTNLERNRRSRITAERNKGYDISEVSPQLVADLTKFRTELAEIQARKQEIFNNLNVSSWAQGTELLSNNINKTTKEIDKLKNSMEQVPGATQKVRELLAQFKYGGDISKVSTDIKEIGRDISTLNSAAIEEINTRISNLSNNSTKAKTALDPIGPAIRRAADDGGALNERSRDLQRLADQAKYFFSITNSIQLFKRTVRSAFNTIKELDEVMTQAAVVTKFDVGDMWKQLPEYAKRADELGVSLKGTYEAATLYYQQGLETDQVIGVSNETLKMAKIAGMDYATATDYMTSALRGFNMEVNEASAQRVNDVYSELAARSASNTEELSIAMSKTAPLAHNAGMEIESTAAILANMIETTREAPETLGTAMKTVIARFQELKKAPDQIGEVDGEIVDANKIETALKSIGVALRDSQGQFRDFDDVIFDISAKWDTLDKNTQRYIATIAAGSRQQSRFIAMVGDYDRTMELVNMANNSAGASAEQFAKTQDSLASKLERLKTAWAEFTMGIANNQIIKAAIDGLTFLLKTVNTLTNALSGGKNGSGLLKSVINTGALIIGIKGARAVLNGFFAFILKTSKTTGVAAGASLGAGMAAGVKGSSFGNTLAAILTPKATINAAMISKGWTKTITSEIDIMKKSLNNAKATSNVRDSLLKSMTGVGMGTAGISQADLAASEIAASRSIIAANEAKAASLDEVLAAYNRLTVGVQLNEEQVALANSLQTHGIAEDQARAIALSGLTEAEIEEAIAAGQETAAKIESNISEEEAIKLAIKEAAAKKGLAQQEARLARKKATGLKNSATLLFGSQDARRAAEKARADANASTNLSKALAGMTIPLGHILVALAAIAAIIAVIHHFSLGQQIKRAEKATEEATKSANEAKEAYDNLLSGKENYDNLQNKLSELTYGTQEFTQALLEANAQVLELMNQYEGLELTTGAYGQLEITQESWDKVNKQMLRRSFAEQNNALSESNRLLDLREKQANKNIENYLFGSGLRSSETERVLTEARKGRSLKLIQDENNLSNEAIENINKYLSKYYERQSQRDSNLIAMISSTLSDKVKESDQQELVSKIAKGKYEAQRQAALDSAGLAAAYGSDIDFGNGTILSIDEVLEEVALSTGIDYSTLEKNRQNGKSLQKYVGIVFDDYFSDAGDEILNGVKKLGDSDQGLVDILSGEWTQAAKDYKIGLSDLAQKASTFGMSPAEFSKLYSAQYKKAQQNWSASQYITTQNLSELGLETNPFLNISNLDTQKIVSNIFNDAFENLGSDSRVTKYLPDKLSHVANMEGITDEILQDTFGSIDWSSAAAAYNDIYDAIDKVEGKLPTVAQELETIIELGKFSSADMFKDFAMGNLDAMADSIKEIADEEGNITGEGIKELAKTFPALNEMIETGEYSLNGLANAINAVNHGASFDGITDSVMNALNKIQTLDGLLADVYNRIDTFEAGRSKTEITDSYVNSGKEFKELINSGIVSGEQYNSYLKRITGNNIDEAWAAFQAKDPTRTYQQFLKDNAEAANLPQQIVDAQQKALKGGHRESWLEDLGFEYKDGILDQVPTMDQIVERMQEKYHTSMGTSIGKEMAQDMFLGYMDYVDGETLNAVIRSSITSAFNTAWEEEGEGKHLLSEEELNLMFSLGFIPDPSSMTPEKLQEWIDQNYPGLNVTVTPEVEEPEEPKDSKGNKIDSGPANRRNRASNRYEKQQQEITEDKKGSEKGKGSKVTYDPKTHLKNINEELDKNEQKVDEWANNWEKSQVKAAKAAESTATPIKNTNKELDNSSGSLDGWANNWERSQYQSAAAAKSTINSIGELRKSEAGLGEGVQQGAENAASAYEQLDAETKAAIDNQQAIADAMQETGDAAMRASAKVLVLVNAIKNLKSKTVQVTVNIATKISSADISSWAQSLATKLIAAAQNASNQATSTIGSGSGQRPKTGGGGYFQAKGTKLSRSSIVSAAAVPSKFTSAASGVYGGLRKNQIALTGELGPELAWDDEGAFLLGSNGPEVAYLKKGTVIYNDKDTKKILGSNSFKGRIKNYPGGTAYKVDYPSGSGAPRRTTSSSSKASNKTGTVNSKSITKSTKEANKETEKWENSLDIIYNLLEKINQEARHREKLEKQYQRLLKKRGVTSKELIELSKQQLASLETQKADELERIKRREQEMKDLIEKNKDLSEYIKYNWDTDTIEVDYDKVNAITDKDKGDSFDKLKEEMERIRDDMRESEDTLEDIEDETWEIRERGKEELRDLEERVIEGLIKQKQEEIDARKEQNDIIKDANSSLLDAIDSNISKMRKDREREKTVNDLEEKQRRLAYLKQDTTGGNAVEIKKLEKELDEAKQDYTDTLVDDRLSELKDLNETAIEQREKQIELLQSQLDYMEENDQFSKQALDIIAEARADVDSGKNIEGTMLYDILSKSDEVKSKGTLNQEKWTEDLYTSLGQAGEGWKNYTPEEMMEAMKTVASFGSVNKENFKNAEAIRNSKTKQDTNFMGSYEEALNSTQLDMNTDYMALLNQQLASAKSYKDWEEAFKYAGYRDAKIAALKDTPLPYEINEPDTLNYILRKFAKHYATGGLVDSTGPAWLDGTKTRPEMVLNAQQTAAFIQLKDILSQLSLSGSAPTSDNYNFNIDIHVDQISNDYDVDHMAEQLERSLYEKAMYRNVNSLRFMK